MASERLNAAIAEMAKQDITFANCDSTWQKRVMTAVLAAADTRPAPAATDTGLERYDLSMFGNGIVEMGGGAYVSFDQAEELLVEANRRNAELEREVTGLRNSYFEEKKARIADNAAKDARIKELEADRDHQSKLSNKLNRSHAALEARLAATHEALEFYANTDNWKNGRFEQAEGGTVLQHYPSSAHKDRGATARAVLGGKTS